MPTIMFADLDGTLAATVIPCSAAEPFANVDAVGMAAALIDCAGKGQALPNAALMPVTDGAALKRDLIVAKPVDLQKAYWRGWAIGRLVRLAQRTRDRG